jgi:hypothetical protein
VKEIRKRSKIGNGTAFSRAAKKQVLNRQSAIQNQQAAAGQKPDSESRKPTHRVTLEM